jgi:hypothetical protein
MVILIQGRDGTGHKEICALDSRPDPRDHWGSRIAHVSSLTLGLCDVGKQKGDDWSRLHRMLLKVSIRQRPDGETMILPIV